MPAHNSNEAQVHSQIQVFRDAQMIKDLSQCDELLAILLSAEK